MTRKEGTPPLGTTADGESDEPVIELGFDRYRVVGPYNPRSDGAGVYSWADVWKRIKNDLLIVVMGPTGILREMSEASIRILSGIGRLPESIATRLEGARNLADLKEKDYQTAELASQDRPTIRRLIGKDKIAIERQAVAAARLTEILNSLARQGLDAGVHQLDDGSVALMLGVPKGASQPLLERLNNPNPAGTNLLAPQDHCVSNEKVLFTGTWDEIVKKMHEKHGDPNETLVEFMQTQARRGFSLSGVMIPSHDAEAFLRGCADAGLLHILS